MERHSYPEMRRSGVEWIGDVPSHWGVRRLGYLFAERREKVSEADMPPLSVTKQGVVDQLDHVAKSNDTDNRKLVRALDLVINSRSDRKGAAGLAAREGSVSVINTVLTSYGEVDPAFGHYLLRCQAFQEEFYRFGRGIVADLWSTNFSEMKDIRVPVPPSDEQRKVASFLNKETAKIQALICAQQRLLALVSDKWDALAWRALNFGVRGASGGVESAKPWPQVPLKRFWQVIDCKHVTAPFVDVGVPVASIREVGDWWVNLEGANRTTPEFYEILISGGRKPRPGDLIFTRNATVGDVSQVGEQHPSFALGQDVVLIRALDSNQSPDFLQHVLKSVIVQRQLDMIMIGATFKRVNVEEIRGLMIPNPPIEQQVAIVKFLSEEAKKMSALKSRVLLSIELLEQRLQSTIVAAVTGKIDVRDIVEAGGEDVPQPVLEAD